MHLVSAAKKFAGYFGADDDVRPPLLQGVRRNSFAISLVNPSWLWEAA